MKKRSYFAGLVGLLVLAKLTFVPSAPALKPAPEGWPLAFEDRFEQPALDTTKWVTTMDFPGINGPRYHNGGYLSYTMDDDVLLQRHHLRLRTQERDFEGVAPKGSFHYSQGLISTQDKFSFTYGYVEIRAKYQSGPGLWPCFWLMDQGKDWPPEFDIAEMYGVKHRMHFGLAHGAWPHEDWASTGMDTAKLENSWHTYALEWMPGRATWYLDGEQTHEVKADYVPSKPMFIILSNSVSSAWGQGGDVTPQTPFPNYLEIQYVRVWSPPNF